MTPEQRRFPQYLRRPQASQYLADIWGLQYAPGTIAKMCALGTGPETHHWGRIAMHSPESLDEFARSRIKPAPKKMRPTHVEARP